MKPKRQQRWMTRKPPAGWKSGDRLLFWKSSPAREMVGLGELVSVEKPQRGNTHFHVRYLTDALQNSLGIGELRRDPQLRRATFLKAGPAMTVFRLSTDHASRIVSPSGDTQNRPARDT